MATSKARGLGAMAVPHRQRASDGLWMALHVPSKGWIYISWSGMVKYTMMKQKKGGGLYPPAVRWRRDIDFIQVDAASKDETGRVPAFRDQLYPLILIAIALVVHG